MVWKGRYLEAVSTIALTTYAQNPRGVKGKLIRINQDHHLRGAKPQGTRKPEARSARSQRLVLETAFQEQPKPTEPGLHVPLPHPHSFPQVAWELLLMGGSVSCSRSQARSPTNGYIHQLQGHMIFQESDKTVSKIHTEENMLRNGHESREERWSRDSSCSQSAQTYNCGGSPQRLAPQKDRHSRAPLTERLLC